MVHAFEQLLGALQGEDQGQKGSLCCRSTISGLVSGNLGHTCALRGQYPSQQFHRLAPGSAEQGVVYDEDIDPLFIGERDYAAANNL